MPRRLDQARDPHAKFYQATTSAYDAYLQGEYRDNYRERRADWDQHFEKMRARFNGFILKTIVNDGVAKLQDLDIAIVGPGLRPIGRDIGHTAAEEILPTAKNIVVVDFSTAVVRSAMEDILAKTEISEHDDRVLGMQFDMTDGLSSAYAKFIEDKLVLVQNEDQLIQVGRELQAITSNELHDALIDKRGTIWSDVISDNIDPAPDVLIGGGNNKERTLALSVNKEPLQMQAWYLPMLIAGTGAAAEHAIWEKYDTIVGSDDRGANDPSLSSTVEGRKQFMRDMYALISRYNTLAASNAVHCILDANPTARVLAVSDVSTVMRKMDLGALPRLNVPALHDLLRSRGIEMHQADIDWKWKDEPEHHHGVNAFTFRRISTNPTSVSVPEDVKE